MVDDPKDLDAAGRPKGGEPASGRGAFGGRRSLRSPNEALQPDHAPPPPSTALRRRRRPLVAVASGILSFVGIAAIALAVVWSLSVQRINAPGPLASDKVVSILPGTDVSGIIDQLTDEGVVDSRPLMTATLWLEGSRSKVKAGEYMFKQSASLRDVIDTLVSGKQILHSITIPEGLTNEQVIDRLNGNDLLVGEVTEVPKEGTLMPDTFKFARGASRDQLIRNMEAEQKRVLDEVWAHRSPDSPIRSPYELVTLASIVEKETGRADERPRVAGVFVNRLTRNMPLQSDPTIVYGLVGGKGTLGRGILKSELEQRTPYNTYLIPGLPPGPIANPGKAALEAVANPSRTKELYFVADGTGGHVFADNLDQHRQNVTRWRQIEKDAKDKAAPDSDKGPAGPAPVSGNQHGQLDLNDPIVGALNGIPGSMDRSPGDLITAYPTSGFVPGAGSPTPPASSHVASTEPDGFQDLDIEVGGVRSKPGPGDEGGVADAGPASLGEAAGSSATFPVSPQRLAVEKAQAMAFGLRPAPDRLPPGQVATAGAPSGDGPIRSNNRFGKVVVIDASEGTSLDPLKDKSYDLNSAKIVPNFKALPPPATSVN